MGAYLRNGFIILVLSLSLSGCGVYRWIVGPEEVFVQAQKSGWNVINRFAQTYPDIARDLQEPEDTTDFLKDHPQAIKATYNDGITLLHVASALGYTKTVEVLLKAGASPNKADDWGISPLHMAAGEGKGPTISVLVKNGANTEQKNEEGWRPLHMAASYKYGRQGMKNLLSFHPKLDAKTELGATPLALAATYGRTKAARALIDAGANMNLQDLFGATPLHNAAMNDQIDVVRLLLKSGANISIRDEAGDRALDYAKRSIQTKHRKQIIMLLEGNTLNFKGSSRPQS